MDYEPVKPEVWELIRVLGRIESLRNYPGSFYSLAHELYTAGLRPTTEKD